VQRFYFDHNATTPMSPEALEVMTACLGQVYGNASSIHHFGQSAKQKLEAARRQLAASLHCSPADIAFTGGGTESDNMAVLGAVRAAPGPAKHVITSAIEHPAVLGPCYQLEQEGVSITRLPVSSGGLVDPDDVKRALRPETVLVSIMHANNELGVIQPLEEIARITRAAGVPLHSDGVQALGKIPVDVESAGIDLYSVTAHKLYGPKGVGALYVRKGIPLAPIAFGGHHERDRRPGTENVPGITGFGAAAETAERNLPSEAARLAALRDQLEQSVLERIPGTSINGACSRRTPNTSNMCFDGIDGEALVIALDLRGFAVSTGAACSSGALSPSHVLLALGLSADKARASMRFSLGRSNTPEQAEALVDALAASVGHLRRLSAHA
jgi:cysteine desulfurase